MRWTKIVLMILYLPAVLTSQNLKIGGCIQTDDRIKLKNGQISWEEYRLDLTGQIESERVKFFTQIWLRSFGSNAVSRLSDMFDKEYVTPVNLEIREAYADIRNFLIDNLDLRIGRQRIAWGTADKLNPTDNLNPDDLEDIWDYGRHLGSNAIKLSYYVGDYTISAVFIPTFTPAVLPRSEWIDVFSGEFSMPIPISYESITIQNPEPSLKESSKFGLKISKRNFYGFDFSISYVYGRDDLPIPKRIILSSPINPTVETALLFFPKMGILGFDFAGDIKNFGVWGEVGIFFPEEVKFETIFITPPRTFETKILERKPYARFVLGFDYTFKNGIYTNIQYLHGFLHERGGGNLKNYIVFNFEKKFLEDRLKLNFLSGGFEFKQLKELSKRHAFILNPQVAYTFIDNLELTIGARIIEGKGKTTFSGLRDRDEVYFKVKYSF